MSVDSAVGFDRAPDRYTGHGRETIDRIRDRLGDALFVGFCLGNAMKYEDRAGRKDPTEQDLAKARWYRQMAEHVQEGTADPRADRSGFVAYIRAKAGQ